MVTLPIKQTVVLTLYLEMHKAGEFLVILSSLKYV